MNESNAKWLLKLLAFGLFTFLQLDKIQSHMFQSQKQLTLTLFEL